MATKMLYQIVGRYMDGKEVTGYHMVRNDGKTERYTKEQVYFLVGRDQVTNCEGQLYQDKVLLRGKGISLDNLPVVSDKDGSLSRTEGIGKIKKGMSAQEVLTRLSIVSCLVNGRNTVGYTVQNIGGQSKNLSRDDVYKLAASGKISNAKIQMYNGRPILRGVGCNITELPVEQVNAG